MKKTIAALLAVLSISASAENLLDYNFNSAQNGQWGTGNVQIYGKASMYSSRDPLLAGQGSLKDSESSLGFLVGEKLDGGLKVRARIETGLMMTDGTTKSPGSVGNFESRLGIGNENFAYDIGQGRHEFSFTITRNDPFAGNRGTLTPLIHNNRALRFSNAMFLKTRTDSGFEVAVDHGQSESTDYKIKPMAQAVSLTQYIGNDGRIGISHYNDSSNNATSTVFGASYQFFPKVKLYTVISFNKDDQLTDIGRTVSAKFAVSDRLDLLESYGTRTRSGRPDIEALTSTLRYKFSKRTFFDINYLHVNTTDKSITTNELAFGLAHIF